MTHSGHGQDVGHGADPHGGGAGHGHDEHGHGGGGGHGHDDHGHAPAPVPERKAPPGAVLIGFLVLLVGEILILSHSGISIPSVMPENISTYGRDVDNLFYVILGLTGFFFFLTEGLLVYFLLRYRARPGEKAKHTHGSHTLEMVWSVVPGVILFGLAIYQTGTWKQIKLKDALTKEEQASALHVHVLGKQFEWHFRYAGADGKFGTEDDVASNAEMHVPVNRKVIVHLRTMDVLHSFWLPHVRLKQDLLPGQTIRQWFEATKTGTYSVVCAELCGTAHTKMGGRLIVESQQEFDAWIAKKAEQGMDPFASKYWKTWKESSKQ